MKIAIVILSSALLSPVFLGAAYYSCNAYESPRLHDSRYGSDEYSPRGSWGNYQGNRDDWNQASNRGFRQMREDFDQDRNQDQLARDNFKTAQDREILRKIRRELANNGDIDSRRITIIVYDGNVKLNGSLRSKEELSRLRDILAKININNIDDNINYPQNNSSWFRGNLESRNDQNTDSTRSMAGNQSDSRMDSDHALLEKVQNFIENQPDSNRFDNVEIEVRNGTVILRGSIDTEDLRRNLKNKIQQMGGIDNIRDQLFVRNQDKDLSYNTDSSTTTKVPDQTLKNNIQDKLKGGMFSRGFEDIEIIVSNGNVTLKGFVEKSENIKTINDRVQDVDGVKSVNNEITVRKINK